MTVDFAVTTEEELQRLVLWLPQQWVGPATRFGRMLVHDRRIRVVGTRGPWLGLDVTRAARRGLRNNKAKLVVEGLEEGAGHWAFLEIAQRDFTKVS